LYPVAWDEFTKEVAHIGNKNQISFVELDTEFLFVEHGLETLGVAMAVFEFRGGELSGPAVVAVVKTTRDRIPGFSDDIEHLSLGLVIENILEDSLDESKIAVLSH